MSRQQITLEVEFRGHQYQVVGRYVPAYNGMMRRPPEPAMFEIDSLARCYGSLLVETDEALEEISWLCVKEYEEQLADAEQEAADKKRIYMKEKME